MTRVSVSSLPSRVLVTCGLYAAWGKEGRDVAEEGKLLNRSTSAHGCMLWYGFDMIMGMEMDVYEGICDAKVT